jgi:hypothetical protein
MLFYRVKEYNDPANKFKEYNNPASQNATPEKSVGATTLFHRFPTLQEDNFLLDKL